MKNTTKVISLLLALALSFSVASVSLVGASAAKRIKLGDLNEDGIVSSTDLVTERKFILGLLTAPVGDQKIAADVDGNGFVAAADLVEIRKSILFGTDLGYYEEKDPTEKTLVVISANASAAKTVYKKGETFDKTGITVIATFDDSSTQSVAIGDCTITGFTSTSVGRKPITVKYEDKTAMVYVDVVDTDMALVGFTTTPANTRITVKDSVGKEVTPTGGKYALVKDASYTYTADNFGYTTKKDIALSANADKTVDVTLTEAAKPAGELLVTTPKTQTIDANNPVFLNAMVVPMNASKQKFTWSVHPDSVNYVTLEAADQQYDGFKNKAVLKPGASLSEGDKIKFICTRENGEEKIAEISYKPDPGLVNLSTTTAGFGKFSDANHTVREEKTGTTYTVSRGGDVIYTFNAGNEYLRWDASLPLAKQYKFMVTYAKPQVTNKSKLRLTAYEITGTETDPNDGGNLLDVINPTPIESIEVECAPTGKPKAENDGKDDWSVFKRVETSTYFTKLEAGKVYRFEMTNCGDKNGANYYAVNIKALSLAPFDYSDTPVLPAAATVDAPQGNMTVDGTYPNQTASVKLTWKNDSGVTVDNWKVFQDNDFKTPVKTNVKVLNTTITGLKPSTVYKFTVLGYDAAGNQVTFERALVQDTTTPQLGSIFVYTPESDQAKEARMGWWKGDRYGLFVHWGIYSHFGGEYLGLQVGKTEENSVPHYSRVNFPEGFFTRPGSKSGNATPVKGVDFNMEGYAEWLMNYGKIPRDVYLEAGKNELTADKYSAAEWVQTAKDAGMKYVVITAKHHDGFVLYDSKGIGYNMKTDSAAGIDALQLLVEECRRQGIKIGFYYSQAIDWLNFGGINGTDEYTGKKYPLDGEETYINQICVPQLQQLVEIYNPDIIWYDMGGKSTEEFRYRTHKAIQSIVGTERLLYNGRLSDNFKGKTKTKNAVEDFGTPEQNVPKKNTANGDNNTFEACMTTNANWAWAKYDNAWKSYESSLYRVINSTAKGGNFLYNIGPKADGTIPYQTKDALSNVGKWLNVNEAAVFGANPGPFTNRVKWGRITSRRDAAGNTTLYLNVTKEELVTQQDSDKNVESLETMVTNSDNKLNPYAILDGEGYRLDTAGAPYENGGAKDGKVEFTYDKDVWKVSWPEDGKLDLPQLASAGNVVSVNYLDPKYNGALEPLSLVNEGGVFKVVGLPGYTSKLKISSEPDDYTVTVPGVDDFALTVEIKFNGSVSTK